MSGQGIDLRKAKGGRAPPPRQHRQDETTRRGRGKEGGREGGRGSNNWRESEHKTESEITPGCQPHHGAAIPTLTARTQVQP